MESTHYGRSRLDVQFNPQCFFYFSRIRYRDTFEHLKETAQCVLELNEGEVSPKADTGSVVKWQIMPLKGLPCLPAPRPENMCVFTEETNITMKRDHGVD